MSALSDVYRMITRARNIPEAVYVAPAQYMQICDELSAMELTRRRGLAMEAPDGGVAFVAPGSYPSNVKVANVPVWPLPEGSSANG